MTRLKAFRQKIMLKVMITIILLLVVIPNTSAVLSLRTEKTDTPYDKLIIEQGSKYAELTLIENTEYCLIDCHAIIEVNLSENFKLPYKFFFDDKENNKKELNYEVFLEREREVTEKLFKNKETCITTKGLVECEQYNYKNNTYKEKYWEKQSTDWTRTKGTYKVMIKAKKSVLDSIDWSFDYETITKEEIKNKWAWWNALWTKKKQILVQELTGTTQYNYSIPVYQAYDTDMSNNFSDIRFIDSTEATELSYWIENKSNGAYVNLWVKLPTMTASVNTTIYMYYGNPAVETTSSIANAFVCGDDFEDGDSSDAGDWFDTGTTNYASSTYAFTGTYSIKASGVAPYNNGVNCPYNVLNKTLVSWAVLPLLQTSHVQYHILDAGGGFYGDIAPQLAFGGDSLSSQPAGNLWYWSGTWLNTTLTYTNATWLRNDFLVDANNFKARKNNGAWTTLKNNRNPVSDVSLIGLGASGGGGDGYMDDVRMRTYAEPEPTLTIGSEETATTTGMTVVQNYISTLANITSSPTLACNFTGTGTTNITRALLMIYNDTAIKYTNNATITSTKSINTTWGTLGLTDDNYKWACHGFGHDGNNASTTNRTFILDGTPPTIAITYPLNQTYTENVTAMNFTVSDTHLQACWYWMGETFANVTIVCGNNASGAGENATEGTVTRAFYANDTHGNLASAFVKYNQVTGSSLNIVPHYAGSLQSETSQSLSIEIFTGFNITQVNGTITYNNTAYISNYTLINDTYATINNTLSSPAVTTSQTITFYWNYYLNNISYNTQNYNQTVSPLSITSNCNASTQTILNITLLDEETRKNINGNNNIEYLISIYNNSKNYNFLNVSGNTSMNNFSVCIYPPLSTNISYLLDGIIKYNSDDYVTEYYNLQNNVLNSTYYNVVNLYDLKINDSTDFRLTFTGSDFLPVENALVYIDRQYIPLNAYETVELPKTDSNGQTVIHLVRNNIIYNIRIIKDGELLGNFFNIVAFCDDYSIGNCKIDLNGYESTEEVFNYNNSIGVMYSTPTYNNNTRVITLSFSTYDGSTKNVNLTVIRNDIFGNNTVCSNTIISPSGTFSCNVSSTISDTTLILTLYVDDTETAIYFIDMENKGYGVAGYLVYFFLVIAFILMFSETKTGILIGILLGFISGIGLGVIKGGIIGGGISGIWLLIIIIIGIWKLNKNNEQ